MISQLLPKYLQRSSKLQVTHLLAIAAYSTNRIKSRKVYQSIKQKCPEFVFLPKIKWSKIYDILYTIKSLLTGIQKFDTCWDYVDMRQAKDSRLRMWKWENFASVKHKTWIEDLPIYHNRAGLHKYFMFYSFDVLDFLFLFPYLLIFLFWLESLRSDNCY